MQFNKVLFGGNLTRDPEFKEHKEVQKQRTIFTIAVNGRKEDETLFIRVTAFGKRAEIIHERLGKGSKIFVEGSLQPPGVWKTDSGEPRASLEMIMDNFSFVGSKSDNDADKGSYKSSGASKKENKRKEEASVDISSIDDISDDEIPF